MYSLKREKNSVKYEIFFVLEAISFKTTECYTVIDDSISKGKKRIRRLEILPRRHFPKKFIVINYCICLKKSTGKNFGNRRFKWRKAITFLFHIKLVVKGDLNEKMWQNNPEKNLMGCHYIKCLHGLSLNLLYYNMLNEFIGKHFEHAFK